MPEISQIQQLSRGGALVTTSGGRLQFGAVPETIKDTIDSPEGVPTTFLMPRSLFQARRGISLADLEFPIFWHFYGKGQKRIRVICRPDQVQVLTAALQEAIVGPLDLDLRAEHVGGEAHPAFPDMRAEIDGFRIHPGTGEHTKLADFVEFLPFLAGRASPWPGVEVEELDEGYAVRDTDGSVAMLPLEPPLPPVNDAPNGLARGFVPPRFGLTMVGAGHGFDSQTMTSGFVLWVEGRGILVDPPVHTTAWLERYELSPRLIDSLILTHCHSDHDAGILQKVLEEGRIRLYTTPTILRSFVRKYGALANLAPDVLGSLFDFVPVRIGEEVRIHGAAFRFSYTLHSIPTIRFDIAFEGKTFVYSADAMSVPETIRGFQAKGVLGESRARHLIDFPWDRDLVLHEAGGPPLHTDVAFLAGLADPVKERLYINHVSARNIPVGSGLRLIQTGLENTVVLVGATGSTPVPFSDLVSDGASRAIGQQGRASGPEAIPPQPAWQLLLDEGPLGALTWGQRKELEALGELVNYQPGEILYKAGEPAEACWLVCDGRVGLRAGPREVRVMERGELAGPLPGEHLDVTVEALTPVSGFRLEHDRFRTYLRANPGIFLRILSYLAHPRPVGI